MAKMWREARQGGWRRRWVGTGTEVFFNAPIHMVCVVCVAAVLATDETQAEVDAIMKSTSTSPPAPSLDEVSTNIFLWVLGEGNVF